MPPPRPTAAASTTTPESRETIPAGEGIAWPRMSSGLGNRSNSPSSIMARAPVAVSPAPGTTAVTVLA